MGKTEDIVNEEQNVFSFSFCSHIAERLGNGQSRKRYGRTCSRRFVHLSEHHSYLRFLYFLEIYFRQVPLAFFHAFEKFITVANNSGFNHFAQQIVPFASTFTDASKYREPIVLLRNVIDKLFDKDCLSYTCTTEQTNLTSFQVRLK